MNINKLEKIVNLARKEAPFYKDFYKDLPLSGYQFNEIPIANFSMVMHAVHNNFKNFYTSSNCYGMFYTTSGTTGKPKSTIFGREEWHIFNKLLASMHWKNGIIKDGDIICNLSEPGSASFMAIHSVVSNIPGKCSEIPIGCDTTFERIIQVYEQFGANVIAGINPTLFGLAEYLLRNKKPDPNITTLLGGGELFYGAQQEVISEAFPNAKICPFIYGATEVGMIGYSDFNMSQNEFKVFNDICNLEIIDPVTNVVIKEPNQIGTVVVTNFVRVAAPAIRLGTGDLAKWNGDPDSSASSFSLLGRLFPFYHRLDDDNIESSDVGKIISYINQYIKILMFQIVINGTIKNPSLEIIYSARNLVNEQEATELINECILNIKPKIHRMIISIKHVSFNFFSHSTRRKTRFIVDNRKVISNG